MKYIKKFESDISDVEVGEYAVLKNFGDDSYKPIWIFLHSNIGEIVERNDLNAIIRYDNIPDNISGYYFRNNKISCSLRYIYKHSFDKNELKVYTDLVKYNL